MKETPLEMNKVGKNIQFRKSIEGEYKFLIISSSIHSMK